MGGRAQSRRFPGGCIGSGSPWLLLRQRPPVKPGMRFSRTRLPDIVYHKACAAPGRVSRLCPALSTPVEFMECEGAVGSHTPRGRPGRVSPHHVCDRLVGCPTGLESGTSLIRDNQALITISRNVDNMLLSFAFRIR